MPDFRTTLYERYVSAFKDESSTLREGALQAYFDWCEHKYLPLVADLPREAPILEIGCGPGHMLRFLQQHGFRRLTGIDVSAEQIRLANQSGVEAQVADVFEFLRGAKGDFSAILAIDFFEHFSKEELLELVPAIAGALSPGGRLILQTPNGEGLFPHQIIYGDLTHMTILTPESLTQLLRLWGFDQFDFHETGPVPKNLVGRLRLALWRLVKLGANLVRRIESGKSQQLWTENMICRATKRGTG